MRDGPFGSPGDERLENAPVAKAPRLPPSDDDDLTLLVLRAQSGDIGAFEALHRRLAPSLLRHLRHIVQDGALAEDLLQDVFVVAFRKLGWLRDPASARPWLYRVATREALRRIRRGRRRSEWQLTAEDWDRIQQRAGLERIERDLTGEQARQAIGDLPPLSRAVLSLHYLEEMPLPVVAALLEVPLGTAKSRLAAGLDRLRVLLGLVPRGPRRRRRP